MQNEAENEYVRLRELHAQALLDTLPEDGIDQVVALAADLLNAPMAGFSLVDQDRVWLKSNVGLDASEIPRDVSISATTVGQNEIHIVGDALLDDEYSNNPFVVGSPFIRSYIGTPIHSQSGHSLGSLFVFDTVPRELSARESQLIECLARELELRLVLRRVTNDRYAISEERAILVDLILNEVGGALAYLRTDLDELEQVRQDAPEILAQCRDRINNLLNICVRYLPPGDRRYLGIQVDPIPVNLFAWLEQFGKRASRLATKAGVSVELVNELPQEKVSIDVMPLERILMNLLWTSLEVSDQEEEFAIHGQLDDRGRLRLCVFDSGRGIPQNLPERNLNPFFGTNDAGGQHAALGLTESRLTAEALGGSVELIPHEIHGSQFVICVPISKATH